MKFFYELNFVYLKSNNLINTMNFLAHIHLSGENEMIKIGNFMADGIRGKQFEQFPADVQKGILLHRFIDTYTDSHDVFRQSTKRLHEKYHHYSGVIRQINLPSKSPTGSITSRNFIRDFPIVSHWIMEY